MFLSLVVAIFVLTSFSASAERTSIRLKGDTAQVVSGHDTLSVSSSTLKSIAERIDSRLNDTLLSGGEIILDDSDRGEVSQMTDKEFELEKERLLNRRMEQDHMETMVISVVTSIVVGVVTIVLLSLLAYYMHRRAKYRVIEKAIENNYKLPDGAFGERVIVRQQPINVPDAAVNQDDTKSRPDVPTSDPQQTFVASTGRNVLDNIMRLIKWNGTARSGMKLILVGISLIIIFLSIDAETLAGVSCIFLLLGGWKLFSAYYDTRIMNIYYDHIGDKREKTATPTQPVTPPPFNGGNEDNQMK